MVAVINTHAGVKAAHPAAGWSVLATGLWNCGLRTSREGLYCGL